MKINNFNNKEYIMINWIKIVIPSKAASSIIRYRVKKIKDKTKKGLCIKESLILNSYCFPEKCMKYSPKVYLYTNYKEMLSALDVQTFLEVVPIKTANGYKQNLKREFIYEQPIDDLRPKPKKIYPQNDMYDESTKLAFWFCQYYIMKDHKHYENLKELETKIYEFFQNKWTQKKENN